MKDIVAYIKSLKAPAEMPKKKGYWGALYADISSKVSLVSHLARSGIVRHVHYVWGIWEDGEENDIEKLKKFHKFNGRIYFSLYLIIAYFCLDFINLSFD
jgi:hypothetical protein